jgi:hypothetical protein
MPSLRNWWKQRTKQRGVRRHCRSSRRSWVLQHVKNRLAPTDLAVTLGLGLGAVLVYWAWAEVRNTAFDPVGLWALIVPLAAYVVGTWAYYRTKAPAQLFEQQRQQLEQLNPPIPWAVAVEVAEEERRITVRLLLRSGTTGTTTIDSATCFFDVGEVRPTCRSPKSGKVGDGKSIQWDYPAEFNNPVWPLPDGQYAVGVDRITSPSLDGSATIGGQFQIGRRKWWR